MSKRAPTPASHDFHPAVAAWFDASFPTATEAQLRAWPLIQGGRNTLVAAPTGSGKTLTAFLAALDVLVRASGEAPLPDETRVLYISPLKALSNDIRVNLEAPLAGIGAQLARLGLPPHGIRSAVRTGDTTPAERNAMKRRAPHILVTTPESLYVLLGSDSGRAMLATVRTVIVDEIHAVAASKRGSHLALSLERLDSLGGRKSVRIGLSATQKPLSRMAEFLVGAAGACAIVDVGHARARDLALELPPLPLEAVMANEVWERVYDRMAELAVLHRTTLIFVNTRRMAERLARHLGERLGAQLVAAHHGSLAKETRLDAEQRLKRGQLQVLIATASLELGIDIGDVDLVCQVGSPRNIAAFLQRVGRSGHQVGGTPKGRLFPTSRDDLVECAALLDCVRRGELDTLRLPRAPLDVLAQHIVAEVANREWGEDALFALLRGAAPYAGLRREQYDAVLRMLADGYATRVGQRGAYLHRDAASASLRARRGGKLAAVTSGGTIPDNADYAVLLEPQGHAVGTVNEDFAVESLAGDIFQLGNTSYSILKIDAGKVRVEDARGAPPNIPFWLGEAPGRSDALSMGVARLRGAIEQQLAGGADGADALARARAWLVGELGLGVDAADQIADYLATARAALGSLPTQDTLVMERFFDASGGMQLVIHSPHGSRINRAWGLALRKRFCRSFNFELQAAATEDAIILSLSAGHSFALDEVWRYLRADSAEHLLIQALLEAPLFNVRWRWNATTALALPRFTGGRKVAPQLQRMKSDDLLAAVFPDQAACLENLVGERELPSHPLVEQTVDDCLHEAMDSEGWLALLRRMEAGTVRLVARDLPAPSPLALEILNARPYAFLDDAPLEERRTQAVLRRRWTDPTSADDLGALDLAAIASVAEQAWPQPANADEMQEALVALGLITAQEAQREDGWRSLLAELADGGRATRLTGAGVDCWVALERLDGVRAVYPQAQATPPLAVPPGHAGHDGQPWTRDAALVELLRARLSGFGPQDVATIAAALALPESTVTIAAAALEAQGYLLRGRFSPGVQVEQWCERHLLARIHRYTIGRLRRDIEPVEAVDFMRFLFDWQHLTAATQLRGEDALPLVLAQLEGWEAAAGAWEADLLALRLRDYSILWLDALCRSGKLVWARVGAPRAAAGGPLRSTPMVLLPRRQLALWHALPTPTGPPTLSPRAAHVLSQLQRDGALFIDELQQGAHMLPVELEKALGELVATGLVNADSFAGLRAMLAPAARRASHDKQRRRGAGPTMEEAGRWALLRREAGPEEPAGAASARRRLPPETLEQVALTLLRRYGVVFWRLLEREAAWLPTWRELLPVYHRLEARGEIRGGRFVAGFSGEQFALPEAIPLLRDVRRRAPNGTLVLVAGVDPLNLCGSVLAGDKLPALAGNRVLFRDGVPVATVSGGDIGWRIDPGAQRALLHARLVGRQCARADVAATPSPA
ncbi:DEAD/DEAH box helicase [Massilia sp. DWR3-1-1]|uniref:DEAD/DEAH box helicase n=1 Tax=Massilia sp. DWR3-1-1 TaxID=2804559 RepID=UPI003CE843A3